MFAGGECYHSRTYSSAAAPSTQRPTHRDPSRPTDSTRPPSPYELRTARPISSHPTVLSLMLYVLVSAAARRDVKRFLNQHSGFLKALKTLRIL